MLAADRPDASPIRRLELYIDAYVDMFEADSGRAILFEYLSSVPLIPGEELIEVCRPRRLVAIWVSVSSVRSGMLPIASSPARA